MPARDSARAARDAARARYELLQQGTRTEQVAAARAAVQRATAALDEVETVASRHTVTAPRAALVEALPYKLGERPPPADRSRSCSRTARRYARSLRARAVADAGSSPAPASKRPSMAARSASGGTVRYVSAEAAFTPYYALTQKDRSRLAYLAEITLDDPAAQALPAGMPVQVLRAGVAAVSVAPPGDRDPGTFARDPCAWPDTAFRARHCRRRDRPRHSARAHLRVSSVPTVRASRPRSACCAACCNRAPARSPCSVTRCRATPSNCARGSAT